MKVNKVLVEDEQVFVIHWMWDKKKEDLAWSLMFPPGVAIGRDSSDGKIRGISFTKHLVDDLQKSFSQEH